MSLSLSVLLVLDGCYLCALWLGTDDQTRHLLFSCALLDGNISAFSLEVNRIHGMASLSHAA